MKETENELEDLSERTDSKDLSSSIPQKEESSSNKEGGRLQSINALLGQESDEEEDGDVPKLQSIDALLRNDSEVINYSIAEDYESNDVILAKYLYVGKDFFYMFILLISSGLNFTWSYFPFLFLAFISYFLLFKSTRCTKKLKKIIEYTSLIYAFALLGIKIYLIASIKNGNKFDDYEEMLSNLLIHYSLIETSSFNMITSFIGECLVIVFSIISLVISYICQDFNTSEQVLKNRNITEEEFYWLMTKCIYLSYFMIVGFAIFNRSILTLCYILPMNLLLFFLSMNSNKNLLFYIFKFLSIIMIIAITGQIFLINLFNIKSIRDSLNTNKESEFKPTINFWTQLGINQAFDEKMKIEKILEEFSGYFFAIASLLMLIFSSNKITVDRMRKAIENSLNNKDIDEEEEENEENFFIKLLIRIREYFLSPNFILHICRISAILWLIMYQNFYSIGIIIWLFFSFLYIHIKSNKYVTIIFLAPMVIICLFCYHISNIDGFCEGFEENQIYSRFGLAKFNHKIIEYILCNIFYFLITLFIYAIFIREERKERQKFKEEQNKKLEQEMNNIEKTDNNITNIDNNNNINNITDSNVNLNSNIIKNDDDLSLFPNEKEKNVIEDINLGLSDKEIDELFENLKIFNIILKALFLNIDKITLIALFFLSVNSINIIHSIFVIIFMLQLLFPIFMIKYLIIMLILTQIVFLFEYIVYLFKNTEYADDKIDLIKLVIPFDSVSKKTSIEYLIYIITYCYYIQYQLYNYDFYQKLFFDKNICLSIYFEIKLSEYPLIKKILFKIGKIFLEFYIWSLIAIFIIFDSYFEVSLLFALKLFIFFIIVFKFLRAIQSDANNHINIILNWFFLIYCSLNTICVYAYQIMSLKFVSEFFNFNIDKTNNFFFQNFPAFGLYRYDEKYLILKFLPHFVCNFISVLFIGEMKRLLKEDEEKEKLERGEISLDEKDDTKNKLLKKKKTLLNKKKELFDKDDNKDISVIKEDEKEETDKTHKINSTDSETNNEGNKDINTDVIKEEDEDENEDKKEKIEIGDKKDEEESEEEKINATEEYERNKKKMNFLDFKYYFYNLILIFTKFYWLFLFLSICIIFTTYDLSIILIIYILIFGITFIRMFRHIISRLSNFIKEKSFFISRLIRYNLIEQNRHVKENTKYRALAFKYLLTFSFLSYFLIFINGIFYIMQNGCPSKICDKSYGKLVGKSGIFENIDEELIISISYIFGFDINLENESVLFAGWVHLFFSALICFDVYVQKIEIYFNDLCKRNRKKYRKLANINVQLKPLTFGEDNILMNISSGVEKVKREQISEQNNNNNINATQNQNIKKNIYQRGSTISFNIDTKNEEEDRKIGEKLIDSFLLIFEKATQTDVKLSKTNKKYRIIQILKNIFEELIIFLLICTAISKLNIWSFVYMLFALYLILTEKTMKKYYVLFCFLIATIILQSIIFVSNLHENTDPYPDKVAIKIMNDYFHIPWYKKICNNKQAFFFGFGVSHTQINLIWMDFIEVVIIYIYLDYFSYSIYQETNTIGRMKNKDNKINYYNLYLDSQVKNVAKKMTRKEYEKHENCMKYNFDLKILPYHEFKYYMKHGKSLNKFPENEEEPKVIERKRDKKEEKIDLGILENEGNNDINNNLINENDNNINNINEDKNIINTNTNQENEENYEEEEMPKTEIKPKKKKKVVEESPLLNALSKAGTMAVSKSSIISNLKDKERTSNKCYDILKQFIYLSIHNVILIVIIIVSMMVSGLISVFYITFSLYFLITSTRIYLGNNYYYPKAIKKILRISILIDISLQILYQSPYINSRDFSENPSTLNKILEIIGLNKILSFKDKEVFEAIVDGDQMVLVLSKAFIYLFMSLQILVYSSESFQEYYLSYIITKNHILRRVSLMNVFKFNNKRIEVMERSIKLRQDMSKQMDKLQKTLQKWNDNIMKINDNKGPSMVLPESSKTIENKDSQNKIKDKDKKEEKKESGLLKTGSDLLSNLLKLKSEPMKKEGDELNIQHEDSIGNLNINNEQKEKESQKQIIVSSTSFSNSLFLNNPFDEEDENANYLPEKEVIESIKNWVLGGFLIRFQIGLHKLVVSYNNITKNERDIYEKDTIQGKIETTSYIENLFEAELRTVDLAHFTLAEMKEVKSFFDGTREKKLEEKKKEKERINKLKKNINKVKAVGKFNKLNELNKEEKLDFEPGERKRGKFSFKNLKLKRGLKNYNTESVLSSVRKQQEKDKKEIINLNAPKFKKLEKFMGNKIFVKYLKPNYIIRCIIKDCLSFFSNNFHWICYAFMILNHIMSSSIISLFYPLSIFCYAILEYPRPKRGYWSFCFIYTVAISTLKFIIQLKFLSENETFHFIIDNLSHFKFGLKLCKSTFSSDFFLYILFDSLVLIILLINDYLLVSKGLFLRREQEIESIYQAMERIAMTKDMKFEDLKDIKKFNDSYLLKEEKKLEKDKDGDNKGNKIEEDDIKKEKIEVNQRFSKVDLDDSIFDKEKDKKESDKDKKVDFLEKISSNSKQKRKTKKKRKPKEKDKEEKNDEENKKKENEDKNNEKYDESKRSYFQTLFPKVRNEKPGNEYYVSYTLIMVFIIMYILLFYTTMVQDKTYGAVSVQTKQFSGTMVIFLLIHVGFLVYDRILFISQNRNNLIYEYILYSKVTKSPLTEFQFNQIKSDITKEYPDIKRDHFIIPPEYADKLKKKYNIVYIQTEEFNMPLFQKYMLHMILVIFGHLFVFFFLPMSGNNNLNNRYYCKEEEDEECNDFLNNKMIILFYFFYIIYYIASGLQVKYGFYDMKRKSVLKAKNNSISGGIYNGFKSVPFLYEIKLGIDWTFTSTCLDLFQWNKFESVYDILYTTNCTMTGINAKLVGQQVGKVLKVGMGGVLSFGLILVLVGPLMLFSSLNPTNKLNNLTSADLKVEISFTYKNNLKKNYTIFQNSKPQSIDSISDEDWGEYNYNISIDTKNFPKEQIQTVTFFEENDRNWDLARPHIENLISLINSRNDQDNNDNEIIKIELVLDYSFYRLLPPESQKASKRYEKKLFLKENIDEEKEEKLNKLEDALSNCYDVNITLEKIYSPPIRLKASSHPKRILDKKNFQDLEVQLGFVGCKNKTYENETKPCYLESYFTFSRFLNDTQTEGIKFHVFSDKVSSTTYNYSVLTFYVTFVLLVGNYVRNFFSGQPEKISLTEMPHNEELLNLCEGIKVSRYSYNFEEEEKLYYILIEIMRSPDYLRLLTSSSIDQFNQRLIMTKSSKTTDDLD